jgi:hypothetical protein
MTSAKLFVDLARRGVDARVAEGLPDGREVAGVFKAFVAQLWSRFLIVIFFS